MHDPRCSRMVALALAFAAVSFATVALAHDRQAAPLPQDAIAACASAKIDGPCTMVRDDRKVEGTCMTWQDGRLFCVPTSAPRDAPPPDAHRPRRLAP